jgi:hypothetical protein
VWGRGHEIEVLGDATRSQHDQCHAAYHDRFESKVAQILDHLPDTPEMVDGVRHQRRPG